MTKSGDNNPTSSNDFDAFIDQAIDELFVPKSKASASGEAAQEPEAAPEKLGGVAQPEAAEEQQDLEISWDQTLPESSGQMQATEPFSEPPGEEQTPFASPEVEPAAEFEPAPLTTTEPAATSEEVTEFEQGPRHDALRPIHEALLSLDWEINRANIDAFERRTAELGQQFADNMHMNTTIKMVLIICKYLRASKSLATPYAIRFLRSAMDAFEVFLAGPSSTQSPDALINILMGEYNDMKADANRIRAVALQRREEDARGTAPTPSSQPGPQAAPASPEPAPATPGESKEELAQMATSLRDQANELLQLAVRLEERLRNA